MNPTLRLIGSIKKPDDCLNEDVALGDSSHQLTYDKRPHPKHFCQDTRPDLLGPHASLDSLGYALLEIMGYGGAFQLGHGGKKMYGFWDVRLYPSQLCVSLTPACLTRTRLCWRRARSEGLGNLESLKINPTIIVSQRTRNISSRRS